MCNEENMILNRLPMQKYQIIQLKKDLEKQSIDFKKFIAEINVVYDFIIDKQEVTNEKTKIALIDLWDMLRKLEQKIHTIIKEIRKIQSKGYDIYLRKELDLL